MEVRHYSIFTVTFLFLSDDLKAFSSLTASLMSAFAFFRRSDCSLMIFWRSVGAFALRSFFFFGCEEVLFFVIQGGEAVGDDWGALEIREHSVVFEPQRAVLRAHALVLADEGDVVPVSPVVHATPEVRTVVPEVLVIVLGVRASGEGH